MTDVKQEGQKTIVSFIVGLLIGGLLVWAFSGPEVSAPNDKKDDSKEEISGGRREYGAVFNISYFYRSLMLEATYFKGFNKIKTSRKSNVIMPINSFGISLSYIIKVFDKRTDKKSSRLRI